MRFRGESLFLLVALCFSHAVFSKELCSREVMCVITIEGSDAIDFFVQNRQSAEITVTLEADLSDMTSSVSLPYTNTYEGMKTTKAFSLEKEDARSGLEPHYKYSFAWTWGNMQATHDDTYLYSLPYAAGSAYRVDQGFNGRYSHYGDFQYAVDWNMPEGTPIHAARDGVVVGVKDTSNEGGPDKKYQNSANYIMIKHDDGTIGEYAHLQQYGVKTRLGERVRAGQLIGLSGNTGYSSGPHLHFFVYKAIDGERRESFPIQFKNYHVLVAGHTYQAS
jgi:murein DD-endopeptidase MepM/ murein hydrolase activator NlpD